MIGPVSRICDALFHKVFCVESNVTPLQKMSVPFHAFVNWIAERVSSFDGDEICQLAGVPSTEWPKFMDAVASGDAWREIGPWWVQLVLSDRPAPLYDLELISTIVLLRWRDGSIYQLQIHMGVADDNTVKPRIADVVTLANQEHSAIIAGVLDKSMDQMHNEGAMFMANPTLPADPLTALLKLIDDGLDKMTPEMRSASEPYARAFRYAFRPRVPVKPPEAAPSQGGWKT